MEEDDHIHSTQLPFLSHYCTRQQGCCHWQPLHFLSWSLTFCTLSLSFCSLTYASIYRHKWLDNLAINYGTNGGSTWVAPFYQWLVQLVWQYPPTIVAFDNGNRLQMLHCQWTVQSIDDCCTLMATILTITPFAIYMGNCHLASSAHTCIMQLFLTYHFESVCGQVYRYLPNLLITKVTKTPLCSNQRITTTRWSTT